LVEISTFKWSLTVKEGINLVNMLIEGTKYEQAVHEFQGKYCSKTMKKEMTKGKEGKKYWKSFMKWHKGELSTKRGEKYAGNQTDWSTYSKFEDM